MKKPKKESVPPPIKTSINRQLSVPMQFFKMLTTEEAITFKEQLVKKEKLVNHINPKRLLAPITAHGLKEMTGRECYDGVFFSNWMSCSVNPRYIKSLPTSAPHMQLFYTKSIVWPSIHHHITAKCKKIRKDYFKIEKHHIILRATEDLGEVTSHGDGMTASRLCDTNGCLSYRHLALEEFRINLGRSRCTGVLLLVRPTTTHYQIHTLFSWQTTS